MLADDNQAATIAEKTRTYSYAVAGPDHEAALNMTGLEYIRALVAGEIGARPSIIDTMGMSLPLDVDYGRAAFEAEAGDFVLNPHGTAHGGFAATMLDSALAMAIHAALPAATGFTTAELKVNYIRAIRPESGRLRAEGQLVHLGRQMATSEGRLIGVEDGKLYAHASTTCFLFPLAFSNSDAAPRPRHD